MVAVAPTTPRVIRVYCPIHKVGFTADANRTIQCSTEKHTVANNLGDDNFWEYCCDCQHYWLLDAAKGSAGSAECPACERAITKRFLCDDCDVVSVESDSPAKWKAYSFSAGGLPQPGCPGCLSTPLAAVQEHTCADFAGSFVTSRSTCPFCDNVLEFPPSFPCSVASYLEKLRAPSTRVQFDPALNHLRETNSGEYVLIEKVPGSALPIVIPAVVKLGSKQDYYETYYELFNCDNPAAGEVIVLSPAVVDKVAGGWTIREPGFIEIKPDAPPRAVASPLVQIPCPGCGVYGDVGHAFCKSCGSPMLGQQRRESTPSTATSEFATVSQPFETPSYSSPDPTSLSSDRTVSGPEAGPPIPWKGMMGIGGGIVGLAIVIISAVIFSGGSLPGSKPSVESKLDRAISAGNLFSPANENAHDLYYELKNSGAGDEKLRAYREKLTPLLTPQGYALISNLMQIGYDEPDSPEWIEAAQKLEWAQELDPSNTFIAARATYCRGRAAYLQKDFAGALSWWTKAAALDKGFVLPVNGIGMVHTANNSFGLARTFFLQALERDAAWPFPEENIGNTYWEEKDYETAKQYYRKAIAKAPNWSKPHIHLAYIALTDKDYATAVSEFETALGPDAIGLKGKEPAAAQKALEKAQQKLSEQGY